MAARVHPRLALGISALLAALLLSGPAAAGTEFRGRVVGVTDGDTLTVLHGGRPERIRLHGIDAPERGQAFGEQARQFASRLAFGQDAHVRVRDRDRYGRTVAEVVLPDGRSLGRELVRAGYAWWYRQHSRDRSLGELEAGARVARRGLWADAHAVPPWEWRRARRAARVGR